MDAWLRRIDGAIEILAACGVVAYCAAAAISVADVLGRRLGMPIVGVVDLVQLCVLSGAWLCIPWAFTAGAHVGVDFVLDRIPPGAARAFHLLAAAAAIALMALILWKSWGAWRMQALLGDRSQQLGIPMGFFWIPLLIGAAASLIAAATIVIRLLTGRATATTQAH